MTGENSKALNNLSQELAYYKKQLDDTGMANSKLEMLFAGVRHELRQTRQGFSLLSKLQQNIAMCPDISDIFEIVVSEINSTLGMDKTLMLIPTQNVNYYKPSHWIGFDQVLNDRLPALLFEFPKEFSAGSGLLLINKAAPKTPQIEKIRSDLDLPFFICLPVMSDNTLIGLLLSGRTTEMKPFYPPLNQGDVDTLQAISTLISSFLNTRHMAVLEEKYEAQMADLKLAASIQSDLLPKTAPQFDDYEIVGTNKPAMIVGGDYYDFIQLDSHRIVLALGDVCGKGLPASLLMANTQATIRGQAFTCQETNLCLERTNSLLYQRTDKKTFVSLFYGILNTKTHQLQYTNAGQNLPILLSSNGRISFLEKSGLVLGAITDVKYREESIPIRPGDLLLIYSDGVCEAMNKDKEEFGEQRLLETVVRSFNNPAHLIAESIIAAVTQFNQDAPQSDDITLIVVKRK